MTEAGRSRTDPGTDPGTSAAAPGGSNQAPRPWQRLALVALALAAVKLLLGPYTLIDDDVHHLLLDYGRGFSEYLTLYARPPHFRLRPLPFFCLWVEGSWLRLPLDVMHALSLAWVGAAALAIGSFTERLTRSSAAGTLAALIMVVHPVQCEVEGWLATRFDAMAIAFVALALAVEARRAAAAATPRGRMDAWLAPSLYLGALLSKESALAFLPVLAVVPWLSGLPLRSVAGAAGRHGAALAAVLLARMAVMGKLVGAEAFTGTATRGANFAARAEQLLLFPVKTPTAYLPPWVLRGLFAAALVLAAAGLVRRLGAARVARALCFLAIGFACCEVPISMTAPGPDLQDPRLLSLFLTCLIPVLACAGKLPLAAVLVASAAAMPGNLLAYREGYAIHRATEATLRAEVTSHGERIFVQGLPAVRAGVKLFFGSVSSLAALCSPAEPLRIVALPDLTGNPEAIALADEILAGFFAQAAYAKWPIRRLVFQPASGRPVFRDVVRLEPGQSLVPGSRKPVPDFAPR